MVGTSLTPTENSPALLPEELPEPPRRRGPRYRFRVRYALTDWFRLRERPLAVIGAVVVAGLLIANLVQIVRSRDSDVTKTDVAAAAAAENEPLNNDPLAVEIRQTLDRQEWGALSPTVEQLPTTSFAPHTGCTYVPARQECVYGSADAPHFGVLVLDDVSIGFTDAVRAALVPAGWRLQVVPLYRCSFVDTDLQPKLESITVDEQCNAHRKTVIAEVQRLAPELVVVSSAPASARRLYKPDADPTVTVARWRDATSRTVTALGATGRRVAVVGGPFGSQDLHTCKTPGSWPIDCAKVAESYMLGVRQAEKAGAAAAGAQYIDTFEWLCYGDLCTAVVGSTPVFADGIHMTTQYATKLAPRFKTALLSA